MSDQMARPKATTRWPRRRRMMLWTIATILVAAMLLPLSGYVYVAINDAQAQQAGSSSADNQTNPRANYWRAVRQGYDGYTAASGPYTTNVLIQNGGQNWRQLRNGPLETYVVWILALVVAALFVFTIVYGKVKLAHAPSGRTVERWSTGERVLHWYTAILFIILAITGLSTLFGRTVLIPVLGYSGFAAWSSVAVALHNYLCPFFIVGVAIEIVSWIRYALPEATDAEWLRRIGGFFDKKPHPSAGHINAGEKYLTFWLGLFVCGIAVSVTGVILDFPIFGQSRETMQISTLIHSGFAMTWLALQLVHIYLGVWGVEGALDAMSKGRVSTEWAKQHHDIWYEREGRKTEVAGPKPSGAAARGA